MSIVYAVANCEAVPSVEYSDFPLGFSKPLIGVEQGPDVPLRHAIIKGPIVNGTDKCRRKIGKPTPAALFYGFDKCDDFGRFAKPHFFVKNLAFHIFQLCIRRDFRASLGFRPLLSRFYQHPAQSAMSEMFFDVNPFHIAYRTGAGSFHIIAPDAHLNKSEVLAFDGGQKTRIFFGFQQLFKFRPQIFPCVVRPKLQRQPG